MRKEEEGNAVGRRKKVVEERYVTVQGEDADYSSDVI
jgi:hypothetical protein